MKMFHETYWCTSSIAWQQKRKDWILRIFTFNDKNPLYLNVFWHFRDLDGQSDQGIVQLVTKPFGIYQT